MVDTFTPAERSRIMRAVKSKDTSPELAVRTVVHAMGFRYRLHVRELPGVPDLVFPSRKAVIFVHGCFWHSHTCKRGRRQPRTNAGYWCDKRAGNQNRDKVAAKALRRAGWRVLVIWECQLREPVTIATKLAAFLQS